MNLASLLSVSRLQEIVPTSTDDIRNNPGDWRGLARVPLIPMEDGDIIANASQRVTAGDILPDGARPLAKSSGPVSLDTLMVANFMRESPFTPSEANLLARIVNNGGIQGDLETFGSYIGAKARENRTGNLARMEQAVWGMFLDSFTYNFGGQQFTVTWGKPSDLKVTPAVTWTSANAATSVPVTDVHSLLEVGLNKYGKAYNRMEIGSADFVGMLASTQFQNLAKASAAMNYLPPAVNTRTNRELAASVLGVDEVVVFGQTIDTEAASGTVTATKLLPAGKVLLSRTQDDGNSAIWRFGNATVLQSINAAILGQSGGGQVIGGGFEGISRGPVAFAMGDLFNVALIDAVRGFPVQRDKTATAVLTIA